MSVADPLWGAPRIHGERSCIVRNSNPFLLCARSARAHGSYRCSKTRRHLGCFVGPQICRPEVALRALNSNVADRSFESSTLLKWKAFNCPIDRAVDYAVFPRSQTTCDSNSKPPKWTVLDNPWRTLMASKFLPPAVQSDEREEPCPSNDRHARYRHLACLPAGNARRLSRAQCVVARAVGGNRFS